MRKKALTVLAVIAIVIMLGIAGRMDYTEEVIYHMPQNAYNDIKMKLGEDASEYDIAKYYSSNRERYE